MLSRSKSFDLYLRKQSRIEGKSLRDINFITKCRNEWKSMTDDERKTEDIINQQNSSSKANPSKSGPPDGQNLDEELEDKIINSLIKFKTIEEIKDTKFFFMSTNIQCFDGKVYRPLEIGITEYTIRNGIHLNYHQFIDCGEIPCGYAFQAFDHMRRRHQIPLNNFVRASDDFLSIGSRILEILSDSCVDQQINHFFDNPMIVFSQSAQKNQNIGSLDWIKNKCNEIREKNKQSVYKFNIKVLSASKLMASLFAFGGDFRPIPWVEKAITSSSYDYSPDTDCDYHQQIDCIECAIGTSKRMTYLLSDYLKELYEIRVTSKHLPTFRQLKYVNIYEDNNNNSFDFSLFAKELEIIEENSNIKVKNEVKDIENKRNEEQSYGPSSQQSMIPMNSVGIGRGNNRSLN